MLALRDWLEGSGGDATIAEAADELGVSREYAYDLFAALIASGEAERVASGRYRRVGGGAVPRPTGPVRP
jgi:DNA-binding IclR family transcriptional regulator